MAVGASFANENVDRDIHVDPSHPSADDANSGTPTAPMVTIGAALTEALTDRDAGNSAKIHVHSGTYVETANIPTSVAPPLLIIEAVDDDVVWSGEETLTGWTLDTGSRYYTTWTHNWGLAVLGPNWNPPFVDDITRRYELVFADGDLLTQVLTLGEVADDTFFVDEAADRLYVQLAGAVDPSTVTIKSGLEPHNSGDDALLKIDTTENVIVRGFTFRYANNKPIGEGIKGVVQILDSSNILLDDLLIEWCGGEGLWIGNESANVTVQNVEASRNGSGGFNAVKCKEILFRKTTTNGNNWRGNWGDHTGVDRAGVKHLNMHQCTYERHTSIGNFTRGFWLDTDNHTIIIDDPHIANNLTEGFFFEKSLGPITVTNATVRDNALQGVVSRFTSQLTIKDSTFERGGSPFYPNILIEGGTEPSTTDWETTLPITLESCKTHTLTGNWFAAPHDKALVLIRCTDQTEEDDFFATIVSDNNRYVDGGLGNVWRVDLDHDATDDTYDLSGWQTLASVDSSSSYATVRIVRRRGGNETSVGVL